MTNAPSESTIPMEELLGHLWADYAEINPQASRVAKLLSARGETVVNDHIALRTFDLAPIGLQTLARPFLESGYQARDTYRFPNKKLQAQHFEPPRADWPKVFISELVVAEMPTSTQAAIRGLVEQVEESHAARTDLCTSGRPWSLSFEIYQALREASEYAAWVAAFGFRANHFTVLVNGLDGFPTLQALDDFLENQGFALNDVGGKIKGSAATLLEQSSTLASNVDVSFADGDHRIPGCYYEFAKRHPQADGTLYQGFIAASADKIFESTDRGQD